MSDKDGQLSNAQVYRRTFVFSWMRLLIDVVALLVLIACTAGGFFVSGQQLLGLGIGALVGIVIFALMVHFLTYLFKAAQVAMMTRGVTEGDLPEHVYSEGKKAVKERFGTVAIYFAVTSAIKSVFNQIAHGLNTIGNMAGGDVGAGIGDVIGIIINTVVSYLCTCCLGWVFFRRGQNAFKSTCEGAVLFFKNWKTLIRNLGRIFGMGLASLIIIGGAFTAACYFIIRQIPQLSAAIANALKNSVGNLDLSDPTVALIFASAVVGVIIWAILHNAFVRPFVLVGVLRNYMAAGINNMPEEDSFAQLDRLSPKFAKLHAKAAGEADPA